MRKQQGFTLIELVMVIVILGVLTATALPKFLNLSDDAKKAAANGVLGAAQAAVSINHAAYQIGKSPTLITNGTTLASALQGGMPSGWVADDVGRAGICTNDATVPGDCDTAKYFVWLTTQQTATVAPAVAAAGTGTW